MEIFFATISFFMLLVSLSLIIVMSKKVHLINSKFDPLYLKNEEIMETLYGDIEGVEKGLVLLSQKIDALPNIIQDDINRSSMALKDHLETTKPIKPNNWDSFREAFKGPARVEINERN